MEADSDSGNSGSLNLVLFPWLAFGHLHPFLELSKALALRGHRITFISTSRNIHRLPRIPSQLSSLITFVPLALPRIEPLPENAEATTDIPPEHMKYLEKAFDGLAEPFMSFLELACSDKTTKPDWIIMDGHHHWLPRIAKAFCIPCVFFVAIPASTQTFFGPLSELTSPSRTTIEQFTVPPNWIPFPSNLAFHPHEIRCLVVGTKENKSGISLLHRLHSVISESDFVCIRTSYELESKWLSLLAKLLNKDTVPVGLLPSPVEDITSTEESKGGKLEFDSINWLNKHPTKSVLYIALGSEIALSTELLHELAFGLEKSGVPFLWALRKPAGISGAANDVLPAGYLQRINASGHVALGLVPQMRILAHASVGGFLTHCGANSVIESMQFGHPLIMLPVSFDQGLNARILAERGLGVEVSRDVVTGNFDREDVARVVRRVMLEEEGRLIRRSAEQIQPIYTDKLSQEKHLDGFIKRLRKYA